MNLYLDQVGRKMAGRHVQLIVENDESNPATAVLKLGKLVQQDKIDILSGICFAHIARALVSEVDKYQIPTITVVAADEITQRRRTKWMLRSGTTASQGMHPFGEWVVRTLGYKKVVTLAVDYPWGWELVGGFQNSFEQAGGQVVQKIWLPLGFKDYSQQIKQIRPGADAVFVGAVGGAAELLPKQYKESGINLPVIGGGTIFDDARMRDIGTCILGAHTARSYFATLDTPANKAFVQAYKAKFGGEPSAISEYAYTTASWIDKAVVSAKGRIENKEQLLAALKKVQFQGDPRGELSIDAYGNLTQSIYIGKVEMIHNRPEVRQVFVYPTVSQFWKWKPEEYLKHPAYNKDYPPCTHCASNNQ